MCILNIECKRCSKIFDNDMGRITFPIKGDRPVFEKEIKCPNCGILSIKDIILTEIGQTQLTEIHMSSFE